MSDVVRRETGAATDDARQVELARRDPRRFAPLYERYVDDVYRYCYRRLGSREAAEDATSQVFTKALAALPSYDGESFRAWLFRIAHNVVIDAYRRRRPQAPLEQAELLPDGALSPEEQAIARDQQLLIRRLLEQLSPDQRAVVELRLAGLSGVEIAGALGRSPGTVKSQHFRAVARMRALLLGPPAKEASRGTQTQQG